MQRPERRSVQVDGTGLSQAKRLRMFYRHHIFCCMNERPAGHPRGCCGDARGQEIRAAFARELALAGVKDCRANKSLCLDRCEHGPVVVIYPSGTWYRIEDVDADVREIVREHVVGGRPVERLMLPPREDDPFASAAD